MYTKREGNDSGISFVLFFGISSSGSVEAFQSCYLHHQRYDIVELGRESRGKQANNNKNKTSGGYIRRKTTRESYNMMRIAKKKELEGGTGHMEPVKRRSAFNV